MLVYIDQIQTIQLSLKPWRFTESNESQYALPHSKIHFTTHNQYENHLYWF